MTLRVKTLTTAGAERFTSGEKDWRTWARLSGTWRTPGTTGAWAWAAGAVAAASSETYEGCIAENSTIAFTLDKPLTIRVASPRPDA